MAADDRQELSQLLRAIDFAEQAHRYQVDKGGEPYLFHCLRVGISLLPDVDAAVIGVLHDVLEDTSWDPRESKSLGLSRQQTEALNLLSRHPFISPPSRRPPAYHAYIVRLSAHPLARKVKIADLQDNLDPRRLALAEQWLVERGLNGKRQTRARVARYQAALAQLEAVPAAPPTPLRKNSPFFC